eukprot:GDKI01027932.1.p1 GENE.GDKI01027932.1~~GDKI01027932.1.p1  ORF type:complete len:250 (-),score=67.93 GDKI01027932.1:241-969(-)
MHTHTLSKISALSAFNQDPPGRKSVSLTHTQNGGGDMGGGMNIAVVMPQDRRRVTVSLPMLTRQDFGELMCMIGLLAYVDEVDVDMIAKGLDGFLVHVALSQFCSEYGEIIQQTSSGYGALVAGEEGEGRGETVTETEFFASVDGPGSLLGVQAERDAELRQAIKQVMAELNTIGCPEEPEKTPRSKKGGGRRQEKSEKEKQGTTEAQAYSKFQRQLWLRRFEQLKKIEFRKIRTNKRGSIL